MKKSLCVGLALVVLSTGNAFSADPVVMMTWGGVWQKTFSDLAATYRTKTGRDVSVVAQASGDAGLARLISQKSKPEVDLWTPNMINYNRAIKAGVIEKLDSSSLKNAADVSPALKFSHGIAGWTSQRGIFYRRDIVPFEPTKWKDLWDDRLKGKVAAPSSSFDIGYFPLAIAVANGGSEKNLDAGFTELSKLKSNVSAFYNSNVQSIRMLEAGEAAVIAWGVLPNVIQYLGPNSKYGFVIPSPAMVAETPFTVVAGSSRSVQAREFIDFLLSPESQATIAAAFGSVPSNPKAPIPDSLSAVLAGVPKSYTVDYGVLSDNLDKIVDRYDREVMAR